MTLTHQPPVAINPGPDFERHEASIYSQHGEDGVLERIFQLIGTTNKFAVEFGTSSHARECNTRYLLEEHGWHCLQMDCGAPPDHPQVRREFITAENINDVFAKHQVPAEFELLSIDIDGNEYWVWKALDARYRPRVLVMEYNASVPPHQSKTIAYDPDFVWQVGSDYFGASLLALERLSRRKGYTLVYCDRRGINAFFIRSDVWPFPRRPIEKIYRSPDYGRGRFFGLGRLLWPDYVGYRPDKDRRMVDVEQ